MVSSIQQFSKADKKDACLAAKQKTPEVRKKNLFWLPENDDRPGSRI